MTMEQRLQIAQRLQAARKQAGLTQGQVAKLLQMSRPTISEVEAGRRRVTAEELTELSKIYDVSITWLTGGDSDSQNPAVELAARELAKLKKDDLDAVLGLLSSLRNSVTE